MMMLASEGRSQRDGLRMAYGVLHKLSLSP